MILVTGATGSIGRHLVRELTEAGAEFTALVRDPGRGAALGCRWVRGDFDDPASLAPALAGVDRLFLNGPGAVPVPDGHPQPMIRRQLALIDAAREAGVRQIVKISVLGARPGGALALGAHAAIEAYLAAAAPGVARTVLRPGGFMQNFATGVGGLLADGELAGPFGDGRVAYIDAADIAACAAALLTGPAERHAGAVHTLTGPEALSHAEIAAALGVPFRDVPPAEAARALRERGLPERFVADLLSLWAGLAAGTDAEVTPAVQALTGRPPRGFAAYLAARG